MTFIGSPLAPVDLVTTALLSLALLISPAATAQSNDAPASSETGKGETQEGEAEKEGADKDAPDGEDPDDTDASAEDDDGGADPAADEDPQADAAEDPLTTEDADALLAETERATAGAEEDGLKGTGLRAVVPADFCSLLPISDYAAYVGAVTAQMRQSGQTLLDIAVPCEEEDMIIRPAHEQTGFSEWVIIASHMDPEGNPLTDVGLSPDTYFDRLADEIAGSLDDFDKILQDSGGPAPTFSEPVREANAIYWPLALEISDGIEAMPVLGVATVTLIDRTPLAAYWHANQARVARPVDAILEDQKILIRDLHAANADFESAPTGGGFPVLGVLAGVIAVGFLLGIGIAMWRRKALASIEPAN